MLSHAKFKKVIDICHEDPRLRGSSLKRFLNIPMSRFGKYPMLLRVSKVIVYLCCYITIL